MRLGPTTVHLVGVTVNPALEAALRVNNWYADGVIETDDAVLIIESKVKPNPGAVGQVLFYLRLAYSTPALQNAMSKPFQAWCLFGESDDTLSAWAHGLGVSVATYTPKWIADYLQSSQLRNRSTPPQNAINSPLP